MNYAEYGSKRLWPNLRQQEKVTYIPVMVDNFFKPRFEPEASRTPIRISNQSTTLQ
jgi:hypothetical protein